MIILFFSTRATSSDSMIGAEKHSFNSSNSCFVYVYVVGALCVSIGVRRPWEPMEEKTCKLVVVGSEG